ncbi:MAG: extracellular solute-binding protein [Propionibacteriaceae bacterium]|jgi:putative aldouronate transport system substrate-binding protein|nr:extracellular solute-binding protein [Propionibacteriaceae bacterium]
MIELKRAAVLAAALALSLGTLTACGSDDSGGTTGEMGETGAMADYAVGTTFKATEPLTFSLMYRDHPNYPYKADWLFLEKLASDQNVSFEITNVPLSDWNTQKPILIASGDAPDIIPVTYTSEQAQYAAGGAILPISDYLEYMPNYKDKVEKWGLQTAIDSIVQSDGKYYVLPGLHEEPRFQYSIAIRDDLWKAAGITEDPKTWDEFKADLVKIKNANLPGVKYPMSDRWKMGSLLSQAAPSFGTKSGATSTNTWGFDNGIYYDTAKGEFVYAGAQEEQKELLKFFASLVKEGLMDPDSLSQDDDQAKAKITTGQSTAIATNDQVIVTDYRQPMEELGEGGSVRMIRLPAGPKGDIVNVSRLESGLMVSAKAAEKPYFKALLQFIDWLYYSDEGLKFAKWGVEGVTYTGTGDDLKLASDVDYNGANPSGTKQLNKDFGFSNGVWMPANGSVFALEKAMLNDDGKAFVEVMKDKTLQEPDPAAPMDEETQATASTYQTQLTDIVIQNTVEFISGAKDIDKDWDAYISALKAAGLDEYVKLYNDAKK